MSVKDVFNFYDKVVWLCHLNFIIPNSLNQASYYCFQITTSF